MKPETMKSHIQVLGSLAEPNQNPALFRYMKLSTLLLLIEGKAFFPSVSSLCKDDPFEGKLFCEDAWLMTELRAALDKDAKSELNQWLRSKAHEWERNKIDHTENPGYRSQLLSSIYIRELRDRRAAWCWFQDEVESAGMWSIYGHKGVAVRTNLNALKSALPSSRSFQLARIRYVDRRPSSRKAFDAEGNDRHLILRPHLLKAIEYKHENEIRVVTECPAKCGGVLVEQIEWRALIEEIRVSPLLAPQEAKAISAMLKKYPWGKDIIIDPSKLLPDETKDTGDELLEAIRQQNGGSHELNLPLPLAEL